MIAKYDPAAWFWIIGGDESRAWSSAAGAYVTQWDAGRVTRIANAEELGDIMREHNLVVPLPTQKDFTKAIQSHFDAIAISRGYDDAISLAVHATSAVPAWAAEAAAFIAWRDSVWLYAYSQLAAVQAQQRAQPSVAELIAELPAIQWPA